MLTKDCRDCPFVYWGVGIGMGIRCNHPDNKKYHKDKNKDLIPTLNDVPKGCTYKEENVSNR